MPGKSSAPEILYIPDLMSEWRTNERKIRRLVEERRIEFIKIGNRVAFTRDAVNAYLAARTVPARAAS